MCHAGHVGLGHTAREALHRIIAGVHLHQHGGTWCDGVGVIGRMRPVGGADFHQFCAGARHDVRNAKGPANFDEFPARHHHFLSLRQTVEHQQHGGRIVVHKGGILGPGDLAQPVRHQIVAVATPAAVQVEFQIGRCGQGTNHRLHHLVGQQRPPQVGVQHGTGEIEDGLQARRHFLAQGGADMVHPFCIGGRNGCRHVFLPFPPRLTQLRQLGTDDVRRAGVAIFVQQGLQAGQAQQGVHRRENGVHGAPSPASGSSVAASSPSSTGKRNGCEPARTCPNWPMAASSTRVLMSSAITSSIGSRRWSNTLL